MSNSEEYIYKLKRFIDDNAIPITNGNCEKCIHKKMCNRVYKNGLVSDILNLKESQTRFPIALKYVKKAPFLLKLVPAFVYNKVYGRVAGSLECPFQMHKIIENIDKIETVYNFLSDEFSKRMYIDILLYRLTFDSKYLAKSNIPSEQYFIDEYRNLGKDEIYVDCGAFIGDTYETYLKHNHSPQKAYLFEPDSENIVKIKSMLDKKNLSNHTQVIDKGVYRNSGKLWFVQKNSSTSYLSEQEVAGAISLEVTSIDEAIKEPITFIKMDIEGSERCAIEGAKNQICQHKPKLAICIYHSISDLWEIPLIIKELNVYENFKVRHYTNHFGESVFYAF